VSSRLWWWCHHLVAAVVASRHECECLSLITTSVRRRTWLRPKAAMKVLVEIGIDLTLKIVGTIIPLMMRPKVPNRDRCWRILKSIPKTYMTEELKEVDQRFARFYVIWMMIHTILMIHTYNSYKPRIHSILTRHQIFHVRASLRNGAMVIRDFLSSPVQWGIFMFVLMLMDWDRSSRFCLDTFRKQQTCSLNLTVVWFVLDGRTDARTISPMMDARVMILWIGCFRKRSAWHSFYMFVVKGDEEYDDARIFAASTQHLSRFLFMTKSYIACWR
jgi:hypothetical protein